MRIRHQRLHEIPPTAGLPLRIGDLRGGMAALADTLAPLTGDAQALVTCSGTAALVVALNTLRTQSIRREVVLPAYTCPLVAHAVARCGLKVRLCDTRHGHFGMDPAALEAVLGPDTLAVIPAHLGGRLDDIATLSRLAHAAGARLVEDAAQALGARHADGTPAGMAGDLGILSLAVGKGLSTFEGGLLLCRDPARRGALREVAASVLPAHAGWELRRSLELAGYWALYRPSLLGLAYGRPLRRALRHGDPVGAVGDRFALPLPLHRMGRWREAVGTRAAARLPGFIARTRAQAAARLPALRALPGIEVIEDHPGSQGTWPFFLMLCETPSQRDTALERLWTRGLGVSRLFIHALPDYPELRAVIPAQDVPHARDFAARSFTISNSPWMDEAAFETVLGVLEMVG